MDQEYFAIYGSANQMAQGGVRILTGGHQPAKLGPGGSMHGVTTVDNDGVSPAFDNKAVQGKTCDAKGGFGITTDASFKYPTAGKVTCNLL